ncbi:MAG: hypothetical protein UR26_C0001G0168 [candidate division TM6 bacterium GW2011_GWF2_32_72]|nr:MAG: hypothetical protein UR26_C0001G0168 [candidate division TM6 bacterium GW2011_GWF2_32_72]
MIKKFGKYSVEITHPDKFYFPKAKITKEELVEYYIKVAPLMLPFLKNRPISMQRFVEGISQEGFYQKNAGEYFPDWIKTKAIQRKEDNKVVNYVVADNAATLAYITNQGCITPHVWLSRIDKLDYPDKIIFDLDPAGKDFEFVKFTALELKKILEKERLSTFVMTTGSKGLHVVIPIKRTHPFDKIREYAKTIAQELIDKYPNDFTLEVRKEKRTNKVFIDTIRNAYGQTGVAPYAVRALPGAPVATPLTWDELKNVKSSQQYNLKNIEERLQKMGDVWKSFWKSSKTLKV